MSFPRTHMVRFRPCARAVVLGAALLQACTGSVEAPSAAAPGAAAPGAAAPGAAASTAGGSGSTTTLGGGSENGVSTSSGAGGSGVSEPLPSQAAAGEFTRLTRAEYLATVHGALGATPDTRQLPEDGRVGPFTSNAGIDSEPVHPYLLAAETLAAGLVPGELPACDAATRLACLEQEYRPRLERLYRRPLSEAEISVMAEALAAFEAAGGSAVEATRALLASALLSPDFLYRAAPGNHHSEGQGRQLAERMSYVLWDAPPDAELTAAALGESLTQNEMLAVQAARLSSDSRAVQILARFFGQWLHVDTDLRLEAPEFEQSPDYLEWLAFVEYAAANAVPVKEFIGSTRGFVHQQNIEAYALDAIDGDGDVVSVEWPVTSGRRGLLGQELLAGATRHPDTSRREIFRGLLVRRSLLCDPIPSPSAALIALAGEVGDRTADVRCKNCHERIDPIGRAFASLDLDASEPVPVAEVLFHDELEGSYQSLGELLEAVATSRAFAACFSRHWLAFFLERDINDIDAAWVAQLADAVESGASLGEVVERTLLQLAAPSALAEPWCEAP